MFDLFVQRVLAQDGGDVMIQLSVLAMQRHDGDADDWEDETQLSYVLAQFAAQEAPTKVVAEPDTPFSLQGCTSRR